ncbi:NAD-dependent epimerase/dehydratase family protein, partial [Pseudoalteromonas sp. SWYJZ12]|nr:NAD-dependent epimerase/dehydratase family protein [Pseudoalteromonas sp. SWYJZ12]
AVIHVASPLPGGTSVDDTLNSAVSGTLNILQSTVKAGIEKMVITSSFGSVMDPSLVPGFGGITFTGADWGVVSREEAEKKAEDPYYVYFASKILAERAIWDFAKEHPQLDIATVLPGFVFGPYADHFPLPTASQLGTNGMIYGLITGGSPPQPPPFVVDVRDVAKTHVLALNVPRKPIGEKRYISNGGNLTWREAVAHLNKVRPEIKTATPESFGDLPGPASTLDTTRTTEDLNFGEWIKPEDTIVAAADALIALQKTW